jgi:uncharacterized protein
VSTHRSGPSGRLSGKHADLVVSVADLLPHPGQTKRVERDAVLDDLAISASRVPAGAPVHLDLELQAVNEGIVVVGTVRAPWEGECRRCLQLTGGEVTADVQEIYERDPVEGETRQLGDAVVDLTEMARDVVLLELPLAPLCADDCAGLCATCGVNRNETTCECATEVRDPRWAALDDLRLED